jgi:hypothetical protein
VSNQIKSHHITSHRINICPISIIA